MTKIQKKQKNQKKNKKIKKNKQAIPTSFLSGDGQNSKKTKK